MKRIADIALMLAPDDPYAGWYREALTHAGLTFTELKDQTFNRLPEFSTLILVGRGQLGPNQCRTVADWVDMNHGQVVACGSTWGLDTLLGITPDDERITIPRTEIRPTSEGETLWPSGALPSMGLLVPRVAVSEAQTAVVTAQGHAAVTRHRGGIYIGPHLGALMDILLLGTGADGQKLPARDGTTGLLDGMPHVIDTAALNPDTDREQPDEIPIPFYRRPHVDTLREIFLRAVVEAVEKSKRMLVLPWYWPTGAEACASYSMDVDDLNVEAMLVTISSLQRYGMPATWMIPVPGLPQDAYRAIRKLGHEIGVLNKGFEGSYTADNLKIQQVTLSRGSGSRVHSVRNLNGFWSGRVSLYQQMAEVGMRYSVTKGAREAGECGFAFGTSHPFAVKDLDVYEVPYLLPGLGDARTDRLMAPLFEQVMAHHGIMHVAGTTSGSVKGSREQSTQEFLMRCRQNRVLQISLDDLIDFEMARRALRVRAMGSTVSLVSDRDMTGLAMMFSETDLQVQADGSRVRGTTVKRFGRTWSQYVVDLERKASVELSCRHEAEAA